MELLERYLQAVRFWLPRRQQDDIIEELRDDIRSRMEEREASLGHPLNEDELADLLRQTGHPMQVAGRYQPQKSLIGPPLLPLYRFVLKMTALCYVVPWIVVWIGLVAFSPAYRAEHASSGLLSTWLSFWRVQWAAFWSMALTLFGAITLIFAVLEKSHARSGSLESWDPRKLPRLARSRQRVSRVETVFGLVFSVFFIVWWLAFPRFVHLLLRPVEGIVAVNPSLHNYNLLPLLPTLVIALQQCINLLRPHWTWVRATFLLAANVMTVAIVGVIAHRYPFLLLVEGAPNAAQYAFVIPVMNQVVLWALILSAAGVTIGAIVHLAQTVQELRRGLNAPQGGAPVQISQML